MVVTAILAIWAILVGLLFVVVIAHIMDFVWLRRSVVVLGGRWGVIVLLFVDVGDMEFAIPMALVFVTLVLCLILQVRDASMNV